MSRSTVAPPPQTFLQNEIACFETNSPPYLLKYGAPCHPERRSIVRPPDANKDITWGEMFFIASFLVSSSHDDETLAQENRWLWEGAISYNQSDGVSQRVFALTRATIEVRAPHFFGRFQILGVY